MSQIKSFFSRFFRSGLFIFKAEVLMWGLFLLIAAVVSVFQAIL